MTPKKSLQERERELQALLGTSPGRQELQQLASRCSATNGRLEPTGTSVITYILVYEREQGLIAS